MEDIGVSGQILRGAQDDRMMMCWRCRMVQMVK
jgi:hypothetical protein